MPYTYDYPRPALTVDILLFSASAYSWDILLIQRKNPPFPMKWALPGGFVDYNEDIADAARRELKEETGIETHEIKQFYTFGQPGRDPRGHTVSVVYFGFVEKDQVQARSGDDAAKAEWFDINQLPELAFDHNDIIKFARDTIDFGKEFS